MCVCACVCVYVCVCVCVCVRDNKIAMLPHYNIYVGVYVKNVKKGSWVAAKHTTFYSK